MHYYQFNIADYRKDTAHLKPIEHYIYRTLIDWYYLDESPIPNETQMVLRRLCLESEDEAKLMNVLNDFFENTDCGWIHRRVDQEILNYAAKCEKNSTNGKLGGRPKKTQSVIFDNQNESQKKPNQEPLTNNHKPCLKEKNNKKENQNSIRENLNDVTDQTFDDFEKLRKTKKAPLTLRAIEQIRYESIKAGITLEDALIECCTRGWVAFKADWHRNSQAPPIKAFSKLKAIESANAAVVKDWIPPEMRNVK